MILIPLWIVIALVLCVACAVLVWRDFDKGGWGSGLLSMVVVPSTLAAVLLLYILHVHKVLGL